VLVVVVSLHSMAPSSAAALVAIEKVVATATKY
jgi:hypothetical protein